MAIQCTSPRFSLKPISSASNIMSYEDLGCCNHENRSEGAELSTFPLAPELPSISRRRNVEVQISLTWSLSWQLAATTPARTSRSQSPYRATWSKIKRRSGTKLSQLGPLSIIGSDTGHMDDDESVVVRLVTLARDL